MQERKEKRIDQLLKNAGLTREIVDLGKLDDDFEIILQGLSTIHKGKQVGYGDYQDEHMGEDDITKAIYHFADIRRKYIRAKNMLRVIHQKTGVVDFSALLDTYTDLAVYSIMGIQMIFDIMEKEELTLMFEAMQPPTDYYASEKARLEKTVKKAGIKAAEIPAHTLDYTPINASMLKFEG